jgi:type II secretory pathway pseudopilin PulG
MPGGPTSRDGERGFTIVEVLVSAAMLMVISLSTFSLIDGAQKTSIDNRARSVAADLAEQDQERMRGMKITALNGFSEKATQTVGGVPYSVSSSSKWVQDANGAPVSCTSTSQADYMRITSTVSPVNAIGQRPPVVMESIIAPPVGSFGNSGTLAVKLKDRADAPVKNFPVTTTDTASLSGTTNDLGCVVFEYVPVGAYTVVLNVPGWVSQQGVNNYQVPATVTKGNITSTEIAYDQASRIDISFDTQRLNATGPATVVPTSAITTRVNNPILTSPNGYREKIEPLGSVTWAPGKTTQSFQGLFPFKDGYTIYSGTCAQAVATTYPANATYFSTTPGKFAQIATNPGQIHSAVVREPAINLLVKRTSATGAPIVNAHVKVTSTTAGCESFNLTQATDSTGYLKDPGFPFGTYNICVDDAVTGNDSSGNPLARKNTLNNVANTNPLGTALQSLFIPAGSAATNAQKGVC